MCSNRTFMELKFVNIDATIRRADRSNRTFMELKYLSARSLNIALKF